MSEPLDEMYFKWLYSQVGDIDAKNPRHTYWGLFKQLFSKEFVWIVPNDDNRIEDGRDLRYEFVDQSGLSDVDQAWINMGCSMLELLIALSRRLAFEAEGQPWEWFYQMLVNTGLYEQDDKRIDETYVNAVLDKIIWRQIRNQRKWWSISSAQSKTRSNNYRAMGSTE